MSIYNMLYDYQKKIVNNCIDRSSYGLFLDMGIGKTPISLALAELHSCNKILIITINSKALETEKISGSFFWWANKSEIKYNFYNKKYSFDGTGHKKYQAIINQNTADILMVNYESIYTKDENEKIILKKSICDFIMSCKNNNLTIIIDESHKIKNSTSIRSKMVINLKKYSLLYADKVYCYLLTGTPFTRGYEDLYTQLSILGWPGNKTYFKDKFCVLGTIPTLQPWEQPIVGYKNINELFELVHKYSVTIKSKEVINLPDTIIIEHKSDMTNEMKLYSLSKLSVGLINKELKSRNLELITDKKERSNNPFYANICYPDLMWVADTPSKFYMRARQLSIGFQGNEEYAKWFNKDRLKDLKKLLEENEDNYVLFYNYTPEFLEIYDICEELGYKIDVYNGIIKSEVYYNEYESLSDEKKLVENKRIIIANYASGSTGKNWQEYNKCILFSLPLFSDYEQAIKRVHRTGQKNTVFYHIFYNNNWLDKKLIKALKEKKVYDEKMFMNDLALLDEENIEGE